MKVLHLVGGELSGGAAKGAIWLHEGLQKLGVSSKILTNGKDTLSNPDIISCAVSLPGRVMNAIRTRVDVVPKLLYPERNSEGFSAGITGYPFTSHPLYEWADIIHLHWINAALVDVRHLQSITKPIVWTMRDMWVFTGGCHYAMECKGYQSGCGRCPQLGSSNEDDLSRRVIERKQKFIPRDTTLVGISRWISDCARDSHLFKGADVITISNNIPIREFVPQPKAQARSLLNLPAERKIVVAGAERPDAHWKGFDLLLATLPKLKEQNPILVLFGNTYPALEADVGMECKLLGMVHDRDILLAAYNAADVFVAPSRMEAFGKTLAEAMACGTPVVSFDATGPADIVDHMVNGYLAKAYEVEDLAKGILWVLNHNQPEVLAQRALAKARTFDTEVIAAEYVKLYNRKLDQAQS